MDDRATKPKVKAESESAEAGRGTESKAKVRVTLPDLVREAEALKALAQQGAEPGPVGAAAMRSAAAATSAQPVKMRKVEQILHQAQLQLVKARLVLRYGETLVSQMYVAPASPVCGRQYAALLLERHLPILVALRAAGGGGPEQFLVGSYDAYGRRSADGARWAEAVGLGPQTFGQALARAAGGFGKLWREAEGRWANPPYGQNVGALPEEMWLHEQLHGFVGQRAKGPGEAHGVWDEWEECA